MRFRNFICNSVSAVLASAVVWGGLALIPVKAEAQTANLLSNNSFEEAGASRKAAAGWVPFGLGYKRVERGRDGSWAIRLRNDNAAQQSGASQRIDLQQSSIKPVLITGYVKGKEIKNGPNGWLGASLYAEIYLQDGTVVYWNSARNLGLFNWRKVGFNTGTLSGVDQPIDYIYIVPILANAKGKAFFDNLSVREYEPAGAAVTVMFDDGETSTYSEGFPAMKKYNFKGSTAIITKEVGKDGFMTWEQIKKLQSERWEVVSHGLSHSDLTTMPKKEMRRELRRSKRQLEKKGLRVKNFALPFGAYNSNIMALGTKWYRSLRAFEQGGNSPGTLPWDVKVRGVTSETTLATVAGWINEAKAKKQWLVIVHHRIAETGDDAYYTTPANLAAMLKVIDDSKVEVVTYDEGLNKFGEL